MNPRTLCACHPVAVISSCREFQLGETRLRGLRLCEPCMHLARLSGKSVIPGLVHRDGLRAQILTDGVIRVGVPVPASERSCDSPPKE